MDSYGTALTIPNILPQPNTVWCRGRIQNTVKLMDSYGTALIIPNYFTSAKYSLDKDLTKHSNFDGQLTKGTIFLKQFFLSCV